MSAASREVSESEALSRLDLLTTTEREILSMLGGGLAAQAIADRVRRGKCTIETHIRHIGNKTGWRGTQRLTRLAILAATRAGATGSSQRDPGVIHELREEIAAHTRSRVALERVVTATADVAGEAFLMALALALGEALGVRLVAVLETGLGATKSLRTAAWSLGAVLQARLELTVADSALHELSRREERFIAADAARLLPRDPLAQTIQAQSCLAVPLRDAAGALLGGVVLMHDAALDASRSPELIVRLFAGRAAAELERRRTDERLRQSELRFQIIAEGSGDIISRYDAVGRRLYASPAIETILGWTPEEVLERSGYDLIYAEDIERVGPIHHAAVANPGTPHRVRWRGRHRNGALVWVETVVRALSNAETGELELLTVTRDVGVEQANIERLDLDKAQLTASVQEREARYRNLVELLPDGIIVHDGATVRFANPAAGTMFGYPSGEAMVGANVMDFVTPALRATVRDRIDRNLRDGADTPRMRQKLVRRDGLLLEAEVSASSCVFDGVPCVQALFRLCTPDRGIGVFDASEQAGHAPADPDGAA